jgi:4-carboxymuconolactone decarboxylase
MSLSEPRIPPVVDETTLDDETRELLDRAAVGQTANIFKTLAHHPDLFRRWMVFANHVLFKSTLPARDRELLIMRTGWRCRSEYEWGQHAVIGRTIGISDEEIRRITQGPDAPGWDSFERALLRAADELHNDSFVSEGTWNTLAQKYTTEQLMDVVFTVGQYTLVSMALNTFGVQLDPGVEGFPK